MCLGRGKKSQLDQKALEGKGIVGAFIWRRCISMRTTEVETQEQVSLHCDLKPGNALGKQTSIARISHGGLTLTVE